MLTINRDQLNIDKRQTPIHPDLEKFATQVSFAKPLCTFIALKDCFKNVYHEGNWSDYIYKLHIYQNGDKVGEVFVDTHYKQGTNERESIYGIKSFRIEKSRGDRNSTTSRDMKVALRIAKKTLVARELEEMRSVIDDKVRGCIGNIMYRTTGMLTYTMDINHEAQLYAISAYQARKKGETTVTVPAHPVTVTASKLNDHTIACDLYMEIYALKQYLKANTGYGIKVMADDSIIMLTYSTGELSRLSSYHELPDSIQSKFAMFKVLKDDEPYAHLGCKFNENIFYIAPDT